MFKATIYISKTPIDQYQKSKPLDKHGVYDFLHRMLVGCSTVYQINEIHVERLHPNNVTDAIDLAIVEEKRGDVE